MSQDDTHNRRAHFITRGKRQLPKRRTVHPTTQDAGPSHGGITAEDLLGPTHPVGNLSRSTGEALSSDGGTLTNNGINGPPQTSCEERHESHRHRDSSPHDNDNDTEPNPVRFTSNKSILHARGTCKHYTYNQLIIKNEEAFRAILLDAVVDIGNISVIPILAETKQRHIRLKEKITKTFQKQFKHIIRFTIEQKNKTQVIGDWIPCEDYSSNDEETVAAKLKQLPYPPQGHTTPDTWTHATYAAPSLEELRNVLFYGRLPYANDENLTTRIHDVLTAACDFSVCQAIRHILRCTLQDIALSNLFEILVNLIRAQFVLFDEHSANTYMLQTVDIITRLINQGFEPYVYAGMRAA